MFCSVPHDYLGGMGMELGLVLDIKDMPVYVREGKSKQDAITA